MYKALATAPTTIPITTSAKKKSGQNQPYRGVSFAVMPKPYRPAQPKMSWGITRMRRNSGS